MFPPPPPPGPSDPGLLQTPFGFDSEGILEPLVPLFAPYCGGVTRQLLLEAAVGQLLMGEWSGERRLDGDVSRAFTLRWHGEPAPLETLRCELHFPDLPSVNYEFTLPAYRLVLWLMQRQDHQLPVSFWRWLLLGELPGFHGGPDAGDQAAVA
ncbi:type IV pilus biogenesis protein EbsA [Cyanobium sp. CH-040]|uniref:type IV pilus biogenesis protein EbsA n=1 Tax=Cyanobium sp. CH-040 TaxID=2823708 RepID=UPI0020CF16EE|nr:type IV pilus biogenesis protein EbsA [Cyanobium sp. CH-040]